MSVISSFFIVPSEKAFYNPSPRLTVGISPYYGQVKISFGV